MAEGEQLNPKLSNIHTHKVINLINFYVHHMESKFQILHPLSVHSIFILAGIRNAAMSETLPGHRCPFKMGPQPSFPAECSAVYSVTSNTLACAQICCSPA